MVYRRIHGPRIYAAGIGALLSCLAFFNDAFGWKLCGGATCSDPRWLHYSKILSVPVAVFGIATYTSIALTSIGTSMDREMSSNKEKAIIDNKCWMPVFFIGIVAGGHGYFTWLQASVLHAWCLLCLITMISGAFLLFDALRKMRSSKSKIQLLALVGGAVVSSSVLLEAHAGIKAERAPDPLVRLDAPSIYRPEATDPSQSLVERMRNSKTLGARDALVHADIFIDFQCQKCAELEGVWQNVLKSLGKQASQLSITYRLFLLEGHPLGWKAAFLSLGAGGEGHFHLARENLYGQQAHWLASGDATEIFRTLPDIKDRVDIWLSLENTKAAKFIIREDVALGASWNIQSSPSAVITRPNLNRRVVMVGLQNAGDYAQAIKEMMK